MKQIIYADNAATTQMDEDIAKEMMAPLREQYANPSSLYSDARKSRHQVESARKKIADCIGAKEDEVFFTSGGTESDNWAIKGRAFCYPNQKKRIITSQIEHHAILRSCAFLENIGYEVVYLPVDEKGRVAPESLEAAINEDTILVSVMLANNEIGTIEPIHELAEIAHRHQVPFHTDAVQAMGHIPVSVDELGVDMLSASGHKFNSPKGIGFLYVRKGMQILPLHHGGAQESNMRGGTEAVASIVAMASALERNCTAMENHREHLRQLENIIICNLEAAGVDYVRNGDDVRIPGNINLSFKNFDGEMILHRLDLRGICVSTGSACNSKETEISHVLKAIHLPEDYARGTIRISLGKGNTVEEVKIIAEELLRIVG